MIGIENFGNQEVKKYIEIVNKKFGLSSYQFLFDNKEIAKSLPHSIFFNEEPIHGYSTSLYYLLAKNIKNKFIVSITGEGVDDIFNGYNLNISSQNKRSKYLYNFCNEDDVKVC